MSVTFWIGLGAAILYLLILLFKAVSALAYAKKNRELGTCDDPVTVLQPILGGDSLLQNTLKANVQKTGTNVQFLWLLDQDDIQGWTAAQSAHKLAPDRISLITCPPCPEDINPKSWKLHYGLAKTTAETIAVLDDDTQLSQGQLGKAVACLKHCDLYTGLPCYFIGDCLWSSLLAHFVNNNSIVTYLSVPAWISPLTINGMFYVMSKATLLRYGGFSAIQNSLCDDYALARLVTSQGGVIQQGVTAQSISSSVNSSRQYFKIMHRWFVFAKVLLQDQSIRIQCLLLITLGLPSLLLWISGGLLLTGWPGFAFFGVLLVARDLILRILRKKIFQERMRFSSFLSILSELLQTIHYIHSCLSPVIQWRRHSLRVHRDGTFSKAEGGTF